MKTMGRLLAVLGITAWVAFGGTGVSLTANGDESKESLDDAKAAVVDTLTATEGQTKGIVTVLSEGFEGIFPDDNWLVGDANSSGTTSYWNDVNDTFGSEGTHSGGWKGYCAGTGYAGTTVDPFYLTDMGAFMKRNIDLTGASFATLTFWYKTPSIESGYDFCRVYIGTTKVWESSGATSSWTQVTINLNAYVGSWQELKFQFDSDYIITAEGWYLDDIVVTKAPATVLSEGFEGAFPGSWAVEDALSVGTTSYWKDVTSSFGGADAHSGGWKGYCAGVGHSGPIDAPLYQNFMRATMKRTIDLTGASSATLSFWFKVPSIEPGWDFCRVYIGTTKVWEYSTATSLWTEVSIDLSAYVGTIPELNFQFDSDFSNYYEGWYLDDILVTKWPAVRPDLVIQSITHTPEPVCSGSNVQFTVTVKNQGQVAAGACNIGFWSNRATSPSIGDVPDQTQDIGGLAAGASITRPFTAAAGADGTYKAWAYADRRNGEVAESNEVNNAGPSGGHAWAVSRPDLVIQSITHTPEPFPIGVTVSFTVTVKNQGGVAAGLFNVGFWTNRTTSPSLGDAPDRNQDIANLAAGATATCTFTVAAGADGSFKAWAYADRINGVGAVAETNEANNAGPTGGHAWSVRSPDLVIQSITHTPEPVSGGSNVQFTVTIKNQGLTAAIGSVGVFNVGFWANRGTSPSLGDAPDQNQDIANLAAGATATRTFTVAAGADGSYKAWAYADRWFGTGEVAESNEVNNAGPSGGHAWSVRSPDLVIQSITHTPEPVGIGSNVQFTVTVRNQGLAAAGLFNVGFWGNRGTSPSIGDVPDQNQDIGGLAAGATQTRTFTVPAGAAGSYKAWAYADRFNGSSAVVESNEVNNAGPSGGHAWSAIAPDLVIQSITHTPDPGSVGSNVQFTVTIRNQGSLAAGLFNVGFWSNRSTSPGIGDSPDQSQDISSLAAGATQTRTFTVAAGAVGSYTAWAYADRRNGASEVVESNEGNNAGPSGGHAWLVSSGGTAVRSISGASVSIAVSPVTGTSTWGVEESIPAELTPSGINGPNGSWNGTTRKITWSGTGSSIAALGYSVAGAAGTYAISGVVTFDGAVNKPVNGDSQVTILSPGQICFGANAYLGQEGIKRKVFVKRINGSSGSVTVFYMTKPKTALPWSDYIPKSGTLTWTNGQTASKVIKIMIPADGNTEGNESFQVLLKNPVGATLAAPTKTTITILANNKADKTSENATAKRMAKLTDALDGEGLTWFTSTLSPWTKQTFVTVDGLDAAISGLEAALDQVSWLETEIEGPGKLSFAWLVKGSGADVCLIMVNGEIRQTLGAGYDWAHETLALGEGDHTVRWVFVGEGIPLQGAAYLDRVNWAPAAE